MNTQRKIDKTAIYAVSVQGLLVFDQPEFPDLAPQVPGGTMEPGETPPFCARREFEEETGITSPKLTYLGTKHWVPDTMYGYDHLKRHFFYGWIAEPLPTTWDNWETDAYDGSPPVRYQFRWIRIDDAKSDLVPHLQSFLHLIPSQG